VELYGDVVIRFVSGSFQVDLLKRETAIPLSCIYASGKMMRCSCNSSTVLQTKLNSFIRAPHIQGPGIAGHQPRAPTPGFQSFGLQRLDHAVGNVPDLMEQVAYMESVFGERIAEPLMKEEGLPESSTCFSAPCPALPW
jgi:hypothetical protein